MRIIVNIEQCRNAPPLNWYVGAQSKRNLTAFKMTSQTDEVTSCFRHRYLQQHISLPLNLSQLLKINPASFTSHYLNNVIYPSGSKRKRYFSLFKTRASTGHGESDGGENENEWKRGREENERRSWNLTQELALLPLSLGLLYLAST